MRPITVVTLALLVAFGSGEPAPAGEPARDEVPTAFDLVYSRVGDTELKLDLARPPASRGPGPFPAVVMIHGGGWAHGSKSDGRPMLLELARRGYVAISPEYRLSPRATFPAQVHDVKAAVRWLKTHAGEYHVDPEHVGAIGFSAGGHLALMLGLTGPADGLEGDAPQGAPSTRIHAVVNFSGPSDLAAEDIPPSSQSLIRDLLGGTAKEEPEAAALASPVTHASKGDAPVLTFQGTSDPIVPYTQAVKLAEALTRAGVPGRVELHLGAGHGLAAEDAKPTIETALAFLEKYLKR